MPAQTGKRPRVLCVAPSSPSLEAMLTRVKAASLDVTLAFTTDSAIALCLGNHFAAVVLDAAFIRNDDWTVAKSLKLIKPDLPIVLLDSRNLSRSGTAPPDIDVLASHDPDDVLLKLNQLLLGKSEDSSKLSTASVTGTPPQSSETT